MIQAAFDLMPVAVADRLRYTHFFTGTDPVYAGLLSPGNRNDSRALKDIWCVVYPWHFNGLGVQECTTVFMANLLPRYPAPLHPAMVIHELGHVLDEQLDFKHRATPITKYARANREEAFAEAFTAWLFPSYWQYYPMKYTVDERTLSLFEQLAGN